MPHLNNILILVFIAIIGVNTSAFGQSKQRKALEQKRQQTLKEIKQINALLFTNKKEEKSVLTRIENLDYKLSVQQNLIEITNEQANLLTREINTNQKEITSLRNQLTTLKEAYAAMILKSYKSKSKQSKVMFLLSSESFKQAYKRLQYIKQYASYQRQQGMLIQEKAAKLQALNLKLSEQKKEKDALVAANKKAKAKLLDERKNRETLMASIRANMSKFSKQIQQKQKQLTKIDKQINKLIKEAIAASNKKVDKTSKKSTFVLTPEAKKLAANFQNNKGKLGWPVTRGVIKGKFGETRSLTDRSVVVNNSGIKIATEKNAPIKVVFGGEVSRIFKVKNANLGVIVRHGNYITIYYNLATIQVKVGDTLQKDQVIGTVFTDVDTGESLLDFRLYKNEAKLNPESWLATN